MVEFIKSQVAFCAMDILTTLFLLLSEHKSFSCVWEASIALRRDVMKFDLAFGVQLAWELSVLGKGTVHVKTARQVGGIRSYPERQECTVYGIKIETLGTTLVWVLEVHHPGSSNLSILIFHRASDSGTWHLIAHYTFSSIHGLGQFSTHEVLLCFYGLF